MLLPIFIELMVNRLIADMVDRIFNAVQQNMYFQFFRNIWYSKTIFPRVLNVGVNPQNVSPFDINALKIEFLFQRIPF